LVRQAEKRGVQDLAVDYPEIDIARAESIEEKLGPHHIDLVINAAAYTAVDQAESEPDLAFAVNRDGASNLAVFCSGKGIPLIHVSTDYVFDGSKSGAYTEDDPVSPVGIYSRSKADGEQAVRDHLEKHIIIRTAWLCGVHGQNFLKTMLRLGKERDHLRVVADQYGCPTFAADLAGAILDIADRLKTEGEDRWGFYHFCGSGETTWHGFAEAIFELAGKYEKFKVETIEPITTAEYPTPAKRPANSVLDCTKIERHFGIRPRHWKGALEETIKALYNINRRQTQTSADA
jgi:dTDP-4-dehydrorhamnose reductase